MREIVERYDDRLFRNFLEDEEAFALLTRLYGEKRKNDGFLKFYYNWRNIHFPVWNVLSFVREVPMAKVYHSPSTGYAGFLCGLMKFLYEKPYIITEHGIYVQEREMEILKSSWLDNPYLKDMWLDFFKALCRWEYCTCNCLITLYQGNVSLQAAYGAPPGKTVVIPNGIKIERFKQARRKRCSTRPFQIGTVARVTPVKDIKTFIQAVSLIKEQMPDVKAYVIGPTEEEPEYYKECVELAGMLGLDQTVFFTGKANVVDYYKKLDVLLLTSIKEAMPLVVMEGMASHLPVVATDTGACRELIYGNGDGIGPAGFVTRIMSPTEMAECVLQLLCDQEMANSYAENGVRRIEKFYSEEVVIQKYKEIYERFVRENGRNSF